MITRLSILLFCFLSAAGSWSQTDVGYLNGSYVSTAVWEDKVDSISVLNESINPFKNSDLAPCIRLKNTALGFNNAKQQGHKSIAIIPLVDIGLQ